MNDFRAVEAEVSRQFDLVTATMLELRWADFDHLICVAGGLQEGPALSALLECVRRTCSEGVGLIDGLVGQGLLLVQVLGSVSYDGVHQANGERFPDGERKMALRWFELFGSLNRGQKHAILLWIEAVAVSEELDSLLVEEFQAVARNWRGGLVE